MLLFNTNLRYQFSSRSDVDPWPRWTGVKRGDELDLVFGRPMAQPGRFRQSDKTLSRFMLQSWTNFVKTGYVFSAYPLVNRIYLFIYINFL